MISVKQLQPSPPSSQSGFTLIECLLAIIIVSVLLVAIAPAISLSVATRIQARRVEQATQAARTYVDGLRAGNIPPPPNPVFIKADKTNAQGKLLFTGTVVPIPQGGPSWTCTLNSDTSAPTDSPDVKALKKAASFYCIDATNKVQLYCVDMDGNGCSPKKGTKDLIIHAFRSVAPNSTNPNLQDDSDAYTGNKGYFLGVRVYRADAFADSTPVRVTPTDAQGIAKRQLATTAGVGDPKTPLVELTTEIRSSQMNYQNLCDRLGGCNKAPAAP